MAEKVRLVEEAMQLGMSIARRAGISPSCLSIVDIAGNNIHKRHSFKGVDGMKKVLGLGLVVGIVISTAAHANDPYVGEWSGDCEESIQCWITIEKQTDGKQYAVTYVAADRLDAGKVLCKVSSTMERREVRYSPSENFDDALSGDFQGSFTYVAPADGGSSLLFDGGLSAGQACQKYYWKGVYVAFGDE